jgi:glycosyltransferase involved in cell wall biosynthesis
LGRARPTILQIIPSLDTGGAELSTAEIAEAIIEGGGRALVATEGGRLADRITKAGGELIEFPAATKNPLRILANARSLKRLIEREKVSLVHARSRAPAWSALLASRRARIPFVTTYHGAYAEADALKRLYNSVMARSDRVIANSSYTASLIASRYGTAKHKIRVIHRGVDIEQFNAAAVAPPRTESLRLSWQVEPDQRIVLHAARLTGWKGQKVVLDAAGRLASSGRLGSVVFVFAGDEQGRLDYKNELVGRASSLGIAGHVRFPGHVADMAAAFKAAHVVVVASVEPEAFGRTATEAQALGCPVIATDIGAPPETVIPMHGDGYATGTGWLVPPGDPEALAECLDRALTLSDGERQALGARARANVAANFTLSAMKQATLAVYDELLDSNLADLAKTVEKSV